MNTANETTHIKNIIRNFFKFIKFGDKSLTWDKINEKIKEIAKKINISNSLKLILSSTGSVTKSLEILSENPIHVETRFQRIANLSNFLTDHNNTNHLRVESNENEFLKLLKLLNISSNDELNFREVWLRDINQKYVFAISLVPIKYLKDEFKEDLIRADIPIGKLIHKYKIECRREIFHISLIQYSHLKELNVEWDDLNKNSLVPYRVYNIINSGEILMTILEFFHPQIT